MARVKTAVLLSGRGSNLQALIDAAADPDFPAEIVRVVSNVPGAGGLQRAEQAGIHTTTIDHRDFNGREPFEDALHTELQAAGVELICLAGFMRLLTRSFVDRWHDRMINIHPSLLPSYKGLHTHERVLADGVRFTGCTVHFVRAEMDAGPIIVQAAVPVHPGDDADTLAARVLTAEHRCYPMALKLVASGESRVVDGRVEMRNARAPDRIQINPDDGMD
ncbi:MAG: phosphoribosylglycinamide formyltransferase [Alphaproteobacteria bacterium]